MTGGQQDSRTAGQKRSAWMQDSRKQDSRSAAQMFDSIAAGHTVSRSKQDSRKILKRDSRTDGYEDSRTAG